MRELPVRMTTAPGGFAVCAALLQHPCDEIKHPCTPVCLMVLLGYAGLQVCARTPHAMLMSLLLLGTAALQEGEHSAAALRPGAPPEQCK